MGVFGYNIPESWLFVPAKEKYISGLDKLKSADVVIFDLEDSLKGEEKEQGLEFLCNMQKPPGSGKMLVRLNSDRLYKELKALKGSPFDGYMLPKFENTGLLDEYKDLIDKPIAALVETPAGIDGIKEIAADKRIFAIAFGAEDFCAALGIEKEERAVLFARSMIVLYTAMFDKISVDMISREYKDEERFEKDLEDSLKTGFKGKLLIHPKQLEAVEKLKKSIPAEEIEKIIEDYEKEKSGAVVIDGRLYEKMHIQRLKKILEDQRR